MSYDKRKSYSLPLIETTDINILRNQLRKVLVDV